MGFTIDTRRRRCPRCRVAMEERMFSDVTVDVCTTCRGLFLDEGELRRIMQKYERGAHGDDLVEEQLAQGYGKRRSRPRGGSSGQPGGEPSTPLGSSAFGAVLSFLTSLFEPHLPH